MTRKRKWKNGEPMRIIHPRNKYADNSPDFGLLGSLYPSFQPYVFFSSDGRPKIDWTDFNATRELTRILLLHDHGLDWWIPDGQLCPTVPNRSNYIHWIEDLLASDVIPSINTGGAVIGFDIGTGANCIYPLLGAVLLGWKFVGSDFTDIAIEWAERNVKRNPHISKLIEIRRVDRVDNMFEENISRDRDPNVSEFDANICNYNSLDIPSPSSPVVQASPIIKKNYFGPPVLLNVVKDGENFDFCMCNPPFFGTMGEAGLNPNTSCGGTSEEMVCPGGELAFITRIIDDSIELKHKFRWFTSLVGRKSNLNVLVSILWKVGITIVKTTEFVQGKTSRWGLAWSFLPTSRKTISSHAIARNIPSFMLEGLQRRYSAFHVLQSIRSLFVICGAACELEVGAFRVDVTASKDQCDTFLKMQISDTNEPGSSQRGQEKSNESIDRHTQSEALRFRVLVFEQIPGTLLVRGMLQQKDSSESGLFWMLIQHLELVLKNKFSS